MKREMDIAGNVLPQMKRKCICTQCGWSGPIDGVLTTPNPFNPSSVITGCIRCFAINSMVVQDASSCSECIKLSVY